MPLTTAQIVKHFVDVNTIDYNREFSRVSKIHKYWSRKPWYVIEKYIEKFSQTGDLVLDPFCGSGLIGLEAILKDRSFIGYDLNPFAIFLAENTLNTKFDEVLFHKEFNDLSSILRSKVMDLYKIKESFLLYAILGKKNTKPYNAVLSNESFKDKIKVKLNKTTLTPKIKFPKSFTIPDLEFPKQFYKDRFSYKGISKVSQMFTERNLLALSHVYNEIKNSKYKNKELFLLAFTNTLLHVSKLKAESVRPLSVNNYWIPDDYIEENVWWRFEDRINNLVIAKRTILKRITKSGNNSYKFYNKSSLKMDEIKSKSVDYLITDPPYGDAIQYSELSYIWNTWLGKKFQTEDEVIINPVQNKGVGEFNLQLSQFIKEADRVLKPNKFFTLCFQNKDPRIWIKLVEMIYHKGMKLIDISSYDTFGSPYNKNWAKFSPKSDFYITFQKSNTTKPVKQRTAISPEQIAVQINEYLKSHNGKSFNINKGYDLFVATVISKIFDGYTISKSEKLSIHHIISMFEEVINNKYGNKQAKLF